MGIRIHKALGYGLVATPEVFATQVNNSRVGFRQKTLASYKAFLQEKYADSQTQDAQMSDLAHFGTTFLNKESYTGANFIASCSELNDGQEVIVLIPALTVDDWVQNESALDYAEVDYACQNDASLPFMQNSVKILEAGQFPFEGMWMDATTGESVRRYDPAIFKYMQTHDSEGNPVTNIEKSRLFSPEGASFREARKNIVPEVPHSIRDIAEWLQIFKQPADWKLLRPMILTEWS